MKRIDFSWEQGFLSAEEYIEKRNQLQKEVDALKPVDYDNLLQAADLLENFQTYWTGCENVEFPREARKQLLAKIIDRVYVYDKEVVAITLHGHYSIVLNDSRFSHHEVLQGLKGQKKRTRIAPSSTGYLNGNDGASSPTGHHKKPLIYPSN